MSKAEEYVEREGFIVINKDYPVISVENALGAVHISKEETKQKCEDAFRGFLLRYVLGSMIGKKCDLEVEFQKAMDKI